MVLLRRLRAQATARDNVTSIRTSGDQWPIRGPGMCCGRGSVRQRGAARSRAVAVQGRRNQPEPDSSRCGGRGAARVASPLAERRAHGTGQGVADTDPIRRTCRADGVLVRPDVPVRRDWTARVRRAPVWSEGRPRGESATRSTESRPLGLRGRVQSGARSPAQRRVELTGWVTITLTDRVAVFDWRTGAVAEMPSSVATNCRSRGLDHVVGWCSRV